MKAALAMRTNPKSANDRSLPFAHILVRIFVLSAFTLIICLSAYFPAHTKSLGTGNTRINPIANNYQTVAQLNQGSPNTLWSNVDAAGLRRSADDNSLLPKKYRAVSLNTIELENLLERTPLEKSLGRIQSASILTLPMPDGSFASYRIEESPIVQQGLADRFPFLKTYRGQGIDDPAATVRFDFMPNGFHAIILSPKGPIQIALVFQRRPGTLRQLLHTRRLTI